MKRRFSAIKGMVLAAVLLQPACESKPEHSTDKPGATPLGLSAHSVIIREPVAGRDVTVAYLTVSNQGDTERSLLGASSEYAKRIEIHEHQHNEGRMRMVKRPSLALAANGETVLESGGAHLMLFELSTTDSPDPKATTPLRQRTVELTLEFDLSETLTVSTSLSSVLD